MNHSVYKGVMYVLVLLVFGLNCTDADSQQSEQTWFEAQQSCLEEGKRLTTNTNEQHKYWTGRYYRVSEWIKILGCFNDSDVEDQAVKETMIIRPSAGLCQEFCTPSRSHIFALKSNRCICLTENFKGESIHPSHCDYTCNSTPDRKFVSDCGGDRSFNVYSFEILGTKPGFSSSGKCLTLQCGGDRKYLPRQCKDPLQQICQKRVIQAGLSWFDSLQRCKNASSYLLGNFTLTNVNESCLNRNNTGPLWIGIAKQTYYGIDEGHRLMNQDETSFQKCEICVRGNCTFDNCSSSQRTKRFCSEITLSTITYPTRTTTPAPPNNITEKNNTSIKPEIIKTTTQGRFQAVGNDTPVSSIVVPIALALVIIGCIAVGGMIYFRRCRHENQKSCNSEYQKKHSPTEETEHCYNEIDKVPDSGYFVLQPQEGQCVSAVDKSLEQESPYNETEEGEYDHLGNNLSRRKVEEDTYCHASSAKNRGYSDYDVRSHSEQQDVDAYDHADKYTESEYGHSQQGEAQDNYDYAK